MPVGNRPKRLCQSLAKARGATTQVPAFGGHPVNRCAGAGLWASVLQQTTQYLHYGARLEQLPHLRTMLQHSLVNELAAFPGAAWRSQARVCNVGC